MVVVVVVVVAVVAVAAIVVAVAVAVVVASFLKLGLAVRYSKRYTAFHFFVRCGVEWNET